LNVFLDRISVDFNNGKYNRLSKWKNQIIIQLPVPVDIQKRPEIRKRIRVCLIRITDSPILLALLPCGLRNAFQQAVFSTFPEYADVENSQIFMGGQEETQTEKEKPDSAGCQ
jgi:hypothetical protein